MSFVTSILVVFLMLGSALGWGSLCLAALGLRAEKMPSAWTGAPGKGVYQKYQRSLAITRTQAWGWGFVLGMAVIGWLAQPLCLLLGVNRLSLLLIVIPGLAGLIFLPRLKPISLNGWTWVTLLLALAGLGLALGDLAEALAPPGDGDSLAYHFALPKQFLMQGHLFFTPRAIDGAVPLLFQMTYMIALGLGGEHALTLWCGLTGWSLFLTAWTLVRPYLNRERALLLALILQGLPAVLYGAGSGQVETRLAALALVALPAACQAAGKGHARWAALAGLAAGFSVAAKYPGLLMVGAAGLIVLLGQNRIKSVFAFGLAATVAGSGWFLWNWFQTGDPMFPMLYGLVPYQSGIVWNDQLAKTAADLIAFEKPMPKTLWTMLTYPFAATFDGLPLWESGRTGLGPVPVLLIPFAALGAWHHRRSIAASPLFWMLSACFTAYAIWFFLGPSQRVRHLVPITAPAVLALSVAAWRGADQVKGLRLPLWLGLSVTLFLELLGQGIFVAKDVKWLASGQTREQFLEAQVPPTALAFWANAHLAPSSQVLIINREAAYLFDMPVYFLSSLDGRITYNQEIVPNPEIFWHQARQHHIDHFAISEALFQMFEGRDCLRPLAKFDIATIQSRTLNVIDGMGHYVMAEATPNTCHWETPR